MLIKVNILCFTVHPSHSFSLLPSTSVLYRLCVFLVLAIGLGIHCCLLAMEVISCMRPKEEAKLYQINPRGMDLQGSNTWFVSHEHEVLITCLKDLFAGHSSLLRESKKKKHAITLPAGEQRCTGSSRFIISWQQDQSSMISEAVAPGNYCRNI